VFGWGSGSFAEYARVRQHAAMAAMAAKPETAVLDALRHDRLVARRGVARYDQRTVHFVDGRREEFDAIVMAKTPPLYLKMMHPTVPSLFLIGLFQPIGCIWRLADHQARIAALQMSGRLSRPSDLDTRTRDEISRSRHGVEVDYHAFRRQLLRELAGSTTARAGRLGLSCAAGAATR
jgi:hypothetical protein